MEKVTDIFNDLNELGKLALILIPTVIVLFFVVSMTSSKYVSVEKRVAEFLKNKEVCEKLAKDLEKPFIGYRLNGDDEEICQIKLNNLVYDINKSENISIQKIMQRFTFGGKNEKLEKTVLIIGVLEGLRIK